MQVVRPKEEGHGEEGGVTREREKETKCALDSPLVARKMRGGIKRTSVCIVFRMAGNSVPEADFDHVNVHNRGTEGE